MAEDWTLDPEAARRFAALGRREVERRMIDQLFTPADDWQANLWLSALKDWTDPNWRDRIVWRIPTGHRCRTVPRQPEDRKSDSDQT